MDSASQIQILISLFIFHFMLMLLGNVYGQVNGDIHGIMVIVRGYRHGDSSSNTV